MALRGAEGSGFKRVGKDLYVIEDQELNFKELLAAPLPKPQPEAALSAHWLAIEGVQPECPQNPPSGFGECCKEVLLVFIRVCRRIGAKEGQEEPL